MLYINRLDGFADTFNSVSLDEPALDVTCVNNGNKSILVNIGCPVIKNERKLESCQISLDEGGVVDLDFAVVVNITEHRMLEVTLFIDRLDECIEDSVYNSLVLFGSLVKIINSRSDSSLSYSDESLGDDAVILVKQLIGSLQLICLVSIKFSRVLLVLTLLLESVGESLLTKSLI